jgi:hypothetical protein
MPLALSPEATPLIERDSSNMAKIWRTRIASCGLTMSLWRTVSMS